VAKESLLTRALLSVNHLIFGGIVHLFFFQTLAQSPSWGQGTEDFSNTAKFTRRAYLFQIALEKL